MKTVPQFARPAALNLAWEISRGDYSGLYKLAKVNPDKKQGWGFYAAKIVSWLKGDSLAPFKVFAKGNSKLPFSAFSTLPIVNCPGAGDCVNYCYSLNAWQYPAAYFRQVQNTILLATEAGRDFIRAEFNKLKTGTLRLYVDGDFKSVSDVVFWMELLASRPDIQAYGYSKSWIELIGAGLKKDFVWPNNYLLNLSNGSKHAPNIKEIVKQLPIVRGEFIAVPVSKVHINNLAYQGPENAGFGAYQKEVIASASNLGLRVFVCKGKCGACLPNGSHACGSSKFKDVSIAIGVH